MMFATDIDDCAINPCLNNGTCVDLVNDYNCSCADGFSGRNCSVKEGKMPIQNI